MPRLFFHRYFCHVKYKILSLFILLLAGHSAFAQQDIIVKGKVSGGDGEHVFYDLMIVNRRMRTGTFANTDGSFTARVQRNDTLLIGAGGYVTRTLPLGEFPDEELDKLRGEVLKEARGWIAQPVVQLAAVPTMIDGELKPRHVDLRPFVVNSGGDNIFVLPGGLTRVALPEGELIVNSSQGGGSKDTWVLTSGRPVAPPLAPAPPRRPSSVPMSEPVLNRVIRHLSLIHISEPTRP